MEEFAHSKYVPAVDLSMTAGEDDAADKIRDEIEQIHQLASTKKNNVQHMVSHLEKALGIEKQESVHYDFSYRPELERVVEEDESSGSEELDLEHDNEKPVESVFENPLLCANILIRPARRMHVKYDTPPQRYLSKEFSMRNRSASSPAGKSKPVDGSEPKSRKAGKGGKRDRRDSVADLKNMEPDPMFSELELSEGTMIPMVMSMASERVPKGLIQLSVESSEIDVYYGSSKTKYMDIREPFIKNRKSLADIYQEVLGNASTNFFEADSEHQVKNSGCPPAPAIFKNVIFSTQTRTNIDLESHLKDKDSNSNEKEETKPQYEIRLMTREKAAGPNMLADDFINNRDAAMSRVVSSRYGKLKYNFGGYVPSNTLNQMETVQKVDDNLSTYDYLMFVNQNHWDFLLHVIIDERADAIARQRELEEQLRREKEEMKNMQKQKLIEEKYRKREEMRHFTPGKWNPGILDYIQEIHERDTTLITNYKKSKDRIPIRRANQSGSRTDSRSKVSKKDRSTVKSTNSIETVSSTNISNVKTESMMDISQMQKDMEEVWKLLRMPMEMRVDMAIKYSSVSGGGLASEQSMDLWKSTAKLIVEREAILVELEHFERTASDPERFFKLGFDGSSKARMQEAAAREAIMERLHKMDVRIKENISALWRKDQQVVTYEGASYEQKMRFDYQNLLKRLAQERGDHLDEEKG